MSHPDEHARAIGWIEEQVAQLDRLRNASPRDPSFKLWRQNTLTVLQRIWPAQAYRSERFRRIVFSPATAKPAGGLVRETFARGCSETLEYLRSLVEEIELVGLPSATDGPQDAPFVGDQHEEGTSMLDLGGSASSAPVPPGYAMEENVLDLGTPAAADADAGAPRPDHGVRIPRLPVTLRTPDAASSREPDADAPGARGFAPLDAPSASRAASGPPVPVPAPVVPAAPLVPKRASAPAEKPAAASPAKPATPPIAPSAPSAGAASSAQRPARGSRPRRVAPRGRLKTMLGFADLGQANPAPAAADVPAPAPAMPSAPATGPAPPAATAPARAPEPAAKAPTAAAPVASAPTPVPAPEPAAKAPTAAPSAPAPSAPTQSELEAESLSKATAEFLRTSPILGLQGRPVQRTSDVTSYMDPDAVALATLAADLGRLGVPESERSALRIALRDLAEQLDGGKPEWERLRVAVSSAMAHPALARRLVPVLLPWLDRAA